jgi:predicted GIY-YIG superfamily endonuclease
LAIINVIDLAASTMSSSSIMHFVYMLRCADGSFYIGETGNIDDRVARHQQGRACSYTAMRLPVTLVYVEEVVSRLQARRRERQLKRWTRRKKEALVAGDLLALKRS